MSDDFINRSDWKENFSVLPNALINDDRVNADGLALLVYLLSKPADWKVNVTNIRNRFGWGRDKSYKVIAHLEQLGYISRWNDRDAGKFGSTAYYVYDAPCTEKPYTEKPYPANQEHTKDRDIQRTDVTNQNKGRGKQKLVDWTPTEDDLRYATDLGLDAGEILADIRLWDEQNGFKAAYASVRAFWQGWCRREAKRRPRALKRDAGPTERQQSLIESLLEQAWRRHQQGDRLLAGEDFMQMRRDLEDAAVSGSIRDVAERYTLRM